MSLSGFCEIVLVLEFATIIESFLVLWLDGSNAGFVVLATCLEILVDLAELGLRCFLTPKVSL
jgi:hypothetical protein